MVAGSDFATFMTYDDEHHRVAFINMPDCKPSDPNVAGVDHCAFTYESIDDLFATYERLKDRRHRALLDHQPRPHPFLLLPRSRR